jgi:hypothetical protein
MHVLYISFSQEKQRACHSRVKVLINLREGRKVNMMLMQVKEGQEAVLLKGIQRGLCIGPTPEVTCAMIRRLRRRIVTEPPQK